MDKKTNGENNKNNVLMLAVFCVIFAASLIIFTVLSSCYNERTTINIAAPDASAAALQTAVTSGGAQEAEHMISETTVTGTEAASSAAVVFPLDLNFATAEELVMVRGIGEVTARKIIDYRDINGYFYSLDELLEVDGIGEKKLAGLEGYLYINYDRLPQTLPPVIETAQPGNAAAAAAAVTEVPVTEAETTVMTAVTAVSEEEFVMVTEEFVTGTDNNDIDFDEKFADYTEAATEKSKVTTAEYYPDFPLELNSASAADLVYISGIGEVIAERIVEYAAAVGFTCVDDLLNVNGIGQSKLEMIRPYVYVEASGAVFTSGTETEAETETTVTAEETELSENTTATTTEPATETTAALLTEAPAAEIYPVNLNTCGKNDLVQIPGIDEDMAENILGLRDQIGYFAELEELYYVIPKEKIREIWDYIYV